MFNCSTRSPFYDEEPLKVNLLKKAGALASASALFGLAVFSVAAGVANAAPVTVDIDSQYILLDGTKIKYLMQQETAFMTVEGCPVGSTMLQMIDGEPYNDPFEVDEDFSGFDISYNEMVGEWQFAGAIAEYSVECTPDGGTPEASSSDSVYFFDQYVEAEPEEFSTGQSVNITAGDFFPGTAVTMEVSPNEYEAAVVYTQDFGEAAQDRSVTGDVVFPEDLECGEYDINFIGGETSVFTLLQICGETPEPSVTPPKSAQPSAPAAPVSPKPGLPSTGN